MSETLQKFKIVSNGNRRFVVTIFGILLSLGGIIFGVFWDGIFRKIVEGNLVLTPDSVIYDLWATPPVKTTLDIYLFNWTNPHEFNNHSVKPILQELGPYRFSEYPEKVNVVWHAENSSVSYRKRSHYYFDVEGSRGSLSDRIVTLNSVAVAAATQARKFSPMRRALTELALMAYPMDLTLRKTANEMLFGGFHDVLLDMAHMLPASLSDVNVPFDKYGYFYGRNTSAQFSGYFNIYTGADDIQKLGHVNTWNYKTFTKSYPRSCANVRGSAGEFQGPNMQTNGTVNIFLSEICRDIPLEFDDIVEVDGVTGYKYIGGLKSMDNGTLYPENKCYCNGDCVPSGVLNVSSCLYDSPIFVSYPHFYNADPYYVTQVEGLNPQKEKHQFEYIIEPRTSIGLQILGRTQVNQLVEPIPNSRMFGEVRKIFFPLFWLQSETRVTPELLSFFRPLPTYVLCGRIFGAFCCFIGLLLIFWYPIIEHCNRRLLKHLENTDFDSFKETVTPTNSFISKESGVFTEKEHFHKDNNSMQKSIQTPSIAS